jgi:Protein of unknown function (DUF2917)
MSRLSMQEVQHLLVTEPAWLLPRSGSVWVTREGDLNDYVLDAGQRLALARGDRVVVSAWNKGQAALWDWTPMRPGQRYGLVRDAAGAVFGFTARALRGAADGLAALARRAAEIACRAQGCIRAGDSMASAGTVQ